ncbi:MAG: GNAT family N-acetyltransferase [Paracoccaceae bacterium]
MEIRSFELGDAAPLGEVFHRSVREGAAHRYGTHQVAAWAQHAPHGKAWETRLAEADTVVAVEGDTRLGFMNVDANGYLDLAFVLPEHMGQGVSDLLYAVLEGRARARGTAKLTTQASLLAEPFFARQGWHVVRRQEVEINGVVLENAWMEKQLQSCTCYR